MHKIIFSLGVILLGLAVGYGLQVLCLRRVITLPWDIVSLRKALQKIALWFFSSIAFMSAVWVIRIDNLRLAALPLLCVLALVLGGGFAILWSHILDLPRRQTGALFSCGSFTNLGAVGSLVCYTFFGEPGLALAAIYKMFEHMTYYGVGFPIAKYYADSGPEKESLGQRLKNVFSDAFVLVALGSLFTGLILNISGVPRPAFFGTVIAVFVPLGTFLLLISIGLAMKFGRIRQYVKVCLGVAAIKFLVIPGVLFSLGIWLGYGEINDGLPLKVLLVLSAMPVAFNALIPPSIYDLDLDLANSCWLFTTLFLVVVLPVLFFLTA
ncbi:MAG: hypothetical protein PVG03_06035 [Desulfarculaceae bacterium]|jgi:predicted permease